MKVWRIESREWMLDEGRKLLRTVFVCTGCRRIDTVVSFRSTLPPPCICARIVEVG